MTHSKTCEISQTDNSGKVDELAMLVRRLVQALRKAAPGNDLAEQALDYLKRNGLDGTFPRDVPLDVPPGMKPSKASNAAGTSPSASAPEKCSSLAGSATRRQVRHQQHEGSRPG